MAQTHQPATAADVHNVLVQFQIDASEGLNADKVNHHFVWIGSVYVSVVLVGLRVAIWTLLPLALGAEPFVTDSAAVAEDALCEALGINRRGVAA